MHLTLDCPAIHDLHKMIDVCKTFADEYKVIFYAKLRKLYVYNLVIIKENNIYPDDLDLKRSNNIVHLGNHLKYDLIKVMTLM